MLTNPAQKVRVFSLIADFFIAQPEYRVEGLRLFEQAYMSVKSIQSSMERTDALSALAQALAQADYWQRAQEVIASIKDIPRKAEALRVLGQMLMQADRGYQATQVWQQAQEVISCITDRPQRARARSALVQALAQTNQWQQVQEEIVAIMDSTEKAQVLNALCKSLEIVNSWQPSQEAGSATPYGIVGSTQEKVDMNPQMLDFLQHIWLHLVTYDEALSALSLAYGLILLKPALGSAFFRSFGWVDAFLKGGDETFLEAHLSPHKVST